MVQRAVRAGGVPPPSADHSSAEEVERLGRDWVILRDCRLGRPARGGALPTVLMHPARGVAVLDILPSDTPGAAETLRARLDAARFPAIFAGHLPVVHLQVAPHRVAFLPSLLDDAFAAQPPLDLPGGDAWVVVAARALRAEQPAPRIEPPRHANGDAVRRPVRRRRTASPLRAAGATLLCLAALGGALGWALNRAPAPAPEAQPSTAVVPPAPGVAPITAAVPPPAPEAATRPPAPSAPAPDPVLAAPVPLPAPAVQGEGAALVRPVPAARQPAPPSAPVARPPAPPLPVPADTAPAPEPEVPPQVQQAAPVPTPPPPRPSRRAETAAPPSPQPAARRAAERAAPSRRQQQEAGTAQPGAVAGNAAPRTPETTPDRCRRVSALVGSGAPIAEADMRFFNQSCIRW